MLRGGASPSGSPSWRWRPNTPGERLRLLVSSISYCIVRHCPPRGPHNRQSPHEIHGVSNRVGPHAAIPSCFVEKHMGHVGNVPHFLNGLLAPSPATGESREPTPIRSQATGLTVNHEPYCLMPAAMGGVGDFNHLGRKRAARTAFSRAGRYGRRRARKKSSRKGGVPGGQRTTVFSGSDWMAVFGRVKATERHARGIEGRRPSLHAGDIALRDPQERRANARPQCADHRMWEGFQLPVAVPHGQPSV